MFGPRLINIFGLKWNRCDANGIESIKYRKYKLMFFLLEYKLMSAMTKIRMAYNLVQGLARKAYWYYGILKIGFDHQDFWHWGRGEETHVGKQKEKMLLLLFKPLNSKKMARLISQIGLIKVDQRPMHTYKPKHSEIGI